MCTLFVVHPVLNLALSAMSTLGYVLHLLTYAGHMQVVNPEWHMCGTMAVSMSFVCKAMGSDELKLFLVS